MSFLLNLYKYRQRENRNQIENYCTETLCYCLHHDKYLRTTFLKSIGVKLISRESYKITTQISFPDFGSRPDLSLESDKTIIFIECKFDSKEGIEQLKRYSDILVEKYSHKNKHLVFLT